jgi:hypothetical protein
MQANPGKRLHQDLGNVYYFELHDYARRGKCTWRAAKPGRRRGRRSWRHDCWKGGSRARGDAVVRGLRSSNDDSVKENARINLQLRDEQDIEQINEIARQFA